MDVTLRIDRHRTFPEYSARGFEGWLKRRKKEQAVFPEQVAYYHGCYVNYNYPQLGKDLVKVLNAMGVGVQLLEKEQCCGIALIVNGQSAQARKKALHNVESLGKAVESGLKVVTTSSTCTLTIRDEYPSLLEVDNAAVRDSVLMATRFICEKLEQGATLPFRNDFHKRIAYHTPCHMEQTCCGMAGTYGFKKENYANSQAIGAPLFDQIRAVNPDVVACDCETCKWQIEMSTGYKVENPISILAEAKSDNGKD